MMKLPSLFVVLFVLEQQKRFVSLFTHASRHVAKLQLPNQAKFKALSSKPLIIGPNNILNKAMLYLYEAKQ